MILTDKLPVTVTGIVEHGRRLGRTIDMPTVNISPDLDLSGLEHGVYFSEVTFTDPVSGCLTVRPGISNLGVKPTVQNSSHINVETYIYDFSGDLYDSQVSVKLIKFKRPEMKFDSFEALSRQMHTDMEEGRHFFSD